MPAPHQPAGALGIDVHHTDGFVDWATVLKSGTSFGFAKATEGIHTVDSRFAENWKNMGEVGITRGAYHFFHGAEDPQRQAENFLRTVSFIATDLPPVLDIEVTDGVDSATLIKGAKTWLDAVETGTNKVPIVYTYPDFWNHYMNDQFGGYPLWIAHYTLAPQPTVPNGWNTWSFWQYASGESGLVHVPGVLGTVDANRYNGTHADLVAAFGL